MVDEQDDPNLVRIAIPGDEKEPKGLFTWQYIWKDEKGQRNICVLFSTINEDGSEEKRRFSFLGNTEKSTAKETLDQLIETTKTQLLEAYKECQNPVSVVDKNPKRKMGFVK